MRACLIYLGYSPIAVCDYTPRSFVVSLYMRVQHLDSRLICINLILIRCLTQFYKMQATSTRYVTFVRANKFQSRSYTTLCARIHSHSYVCICIRPICMRNLTSGTLISACAATAGGDDNSSIKWNAHQNTFIAISSPYSHQRCSVKHFLRYHHRQRHPCLIWHTINL